MRIFDETKTYELNESTIDLTKGRLVADKKFIMHHDAVLGQEAVYVDRPVTYPNSSTSIFKELITPAVEAKEAYDEYEDIQVYVPYTEEELKDIKRSKRVPLLNAFDKWEKALLRGREVEDSNISLIWYPNLLDLKDNAFENIPERIKYYL